MKIASRIKKLEKKFIGSRQHWAVFSIGRYEDPCEMSRAGQRLVDVYIAKGNPSPTHRIFINEVPFPRAECQEGFLCEFSRRIGGE